ncbi:Cycloartenol synthase [Vitis vinifera]|uniref:Cycloartenol synthase n=1 Tax=Vitis vinifera TaxID=29760 RepID=A0A438H150_VITVI|nr:Cycloartenol synthase [Vitis vinifera]
MAYKCHLSRIKDYLWMAEDGMKMQVRSNSLGNFNLWYHHISKGGWPFSTLDNGWPVSDCTVEGLKNSNGGFASYELTRSYAWYGSWGVCYTYGTWFGVKGLLAGGRTYQNCSSIRRACDFLLSKQLHSGGWGESYRSCKDKVYTNLEGNKSHLVHTRWAMLALIRAGQVGGKGPNPIASCNKASN